MQEIDDLVLKFTQVRVVDRNSQRVVGYVVAPKSTVLNYLKCAISVLFPKMKLGWLTPEFEQFPNIHHTFVHQEYCIYPDPATKEIWLNLASKFTTSQIPLASDVLEESR